MKNYEQPLITIIVAMYKGEKYIKDCIESIITQDYQNLEIILVDDGSPDNCYNIAKYYSERDNRIKLFTQKNAGACAARNKGLEVAKGKYISIMDQDDIISKEYIRYLYNLAIENNAEIALTPKVDKFFYNIKIDSKKDNTYLCSGKDAVIKMLYHKINIGPWNKIVSRELIEKNNIRFNTNFFNGDGFIFSIECFQNAKKVKIGNKIYYHYRVGDSESGASKFKEEWINSSINAQQYIKENLKFKTKEVIEAWKFSNWHTYCDALNIIVGCGVNKKYKELYNKLKEECKKDALLALRAPVSVQQKSRGILFKINPYLASRIINIFRIRKFKKISE